MMLITIKIFLLTVITIAVRRMIYDRPSQCNLLLLLLISRVRTRPSQCNLVLLLNSQLRRMAGQRWGWRMKSCWDGWLGYSNSRGCSRKRFCLTLLLWWWEIVHCLAISSSYFTMLAKWSSSWSTIIMYCKTLNFCVHLIFANFAHRVKSRN